MKLSELILVAALALFIGYSFTMLFMELSTVRTNVERMVLNK